MMILKWFLESPAWRWVDNKTIRESQFVVIFLKVTGDEKGVAAYLMRWSMIKEWSRLTVQVCKNVLCGSQSLPLVYPRTFIWHMFFLGQSPCSHILGVPALPATFPLCPSFLGLDKGPRWSAPASFSTLAAQSYPAFGKSRIGGQGKVLQPVGSVAMACPSVHFL